jgi:hypothetical protein
MPANRSTSARALLELLERPLELLELLARFGEFPLRGQALIIAEMTPRFGNKRVQVG